MGEGTRELNGDVRLASVRHVNIDDTTSKDDIRPSI